MWTNCFQNPLIHIDFNMFVDEKTSVKKKEIPERAIDLLLLHYCLLPVTQFRTDLNENEVDWFPRVFSVDLDLIQIVD